MGAQRVCLTVHYGLQCDGVGLSLGAMIHKVNAFDIYYPQICNSTLNNVASKEVPELLD